MSKVSIQKKRCGAAWRLVLGIAFIAAGAATFASSACRAEETGNEKTAGVVKQVAGQVQPLIEKELAAAEKVSMAELTVGRRFTAHFQTPVRQKAITDPWGGMADLEKHGLENVNQSLPPRRGQTYQPRATPWDSRTVENLAPKGRHNLLLNHTLCRPFRAYFIPALVPRALPWAGMLRPGLGKKQFIHNLLGVIHAGQQDGNPLPAMLDRLSASLGKPVGNAVAVKRPELTSLDDHSAYITAVFDQARASHDEAIKKIPADMRKFLFAWSNTMTQTFGPQLSFNEETKPLLQNDRAFCALIQLNVDWAKFLGTAHTLCRLGDPQYLESLQEVLADAGPIDEKVEGVSGDLLWKKETPHGLILFGGKGKNVYDLKQPVALIVDWGGDDVYRGKVAASYDADHPHAVTIDLAGNDTYEASELGLATGRLGVGLLIDVEGDDKYDLKRGSGGVGLAGFGLLCDLDGDDVYTGSQFSQGVALVGIGLLYDRAGNDIYTSHALALGLGGPMGAGAVIDVAGNDRYQCGKKIASGYNESDHPGIKPDDPRYQWVALGMGMGLGRRITSPDRRQWQYALAGGIGIVGDASGDDQYESSNFSQGCGYYFGAGLKLDLAGDDVHNAARYGHASGAHVGMGLFVDYAGEDKYHSTGPTYNGGCSWDHSVFLFVDAGNQSDLYEFGRTSGLGRADIGSWCVFAELGGDDTYIAPDPGGHTTKKSLAIFFDAAGLDDYEGIKNTKDLEPADGLTQASDGALFVDRE